MIDWNIENLNDEQIAFLRDLSSRRVAVVKVMVKRIMPVIDSTPLPSRRPRDGLN